MRQVKRAIIIAAGTGTRMHPLTLEIPKPMVRVNGVRMIDTVIQGLHHNGIYEIYVVVGYLKEQFKALEQEYDGLTLIDNPYYDHCNNIASLYVARDYIDDTFILDGDQIIYDDSILNRVFDKSGYNCVWCEGSTNEWLLDVEHDVVQQCHRNGGKHGWQLFGISRWSKEDGMKLKKHLEIEFEEKKNHQIYWDDVAMFCYPKEYTLGVYPMHYGDIIEIDSLQELVDKDPGYKRYLKG